MRSITLKTIFTILVLLTAGVSTALSQSVGLGIEGGLNLSDISSTPTLNTSNRTGFMVGGFADFELSDIVGIRPGIRYISKGFSLTDNLGTTYTDRLSYLEFPLLLKVTFPVRQVKPYIVAGPTLGIQLSASEEANGNLNLQQNQSYDVSQSYQSVDFGLYFGSGLEFHVAHNTDMFTGFGYQLGLTSTIKSTTVTTKNYGLQFTAGVKFGL